MSEPDVRDMISRSSLVSDLNADQCGILAGITGRRSLADGEVLIEEGASDDTLYVVGSGRLAVERTTAGGEPITLHVLQSGDLAGELGFVDGTAHTATLRAVGPTVVLTITRSDLDGILTTHPDVVYGVMRGIIRMVHRILRAMNLQFVELSNYITKTHGRY